MSDREYVPVEMVYAGTRVGNSGKRLYAWAPVTNLEDVSLFGKQLVPASVGGVYLMDVVYTADGGMSVRGTVPEYLGRLDDRGSETYTQEHADAVLRWAGKDEAARQHLARKSMATKAAKVDPLDDLLRPVVRAASTMNTTERRALLARLASDIMYA